MIATFARARAGCAAWKMTLGHTYVDNLGRWLLDAGLAAPTAWTNALSGACGEDGQQASPAGKGIGDGFAAFECSAAGDSATLTF